MFRFDSLADMEIDRKTHRQIDRLSDWLIDWLIYWFKYRSRGKHGGKKIKGKNEKNEKEKIKRIWLRFIEKKNVKIRQCLHNLTCFLSKIYFLFK